MLYGRSVHGGLVSVPMDVPWYVPWDAPWDVQWDVPLDIPWDVLWDVPWAVPCDVPWTSHGTHAPNLTGVLRAQRAYLTPLRRLFSFFARCLRRFFDFHGFGVFCAPMRAKICQWGFQEVRTGGGFVLPQYELVWPYGGPIRFRFCTGMGSFFA